MNYLQHNKVNYLQDSQPVLVYDNIVTSYNSCSYIIYKDDRIQSNVTYIDLNPLLKDNTLVNNTYNTYNSYVGILIYNIIPAFTNSDVTSINSSDTITFTVTINDKVYKHTYSVLPLYINTFTLNNHLQFNDILTTFKVKYESTCELTYIPTRYDRYDTTVANLVFL